MKVVEKKVTEHLRVKLTDDDRLRMGGEMADQAAAVEKLKDDLKTSTASINGQIKAAEAKVSTMANTIRNGYEVRPVECDIEMNLDKGMLKKTRTDTGDVIEDRQMRRDEIDRENLLFKD